MKKSHEKELEEQKEEYSLLLREESSKWKIQREDLENEIIKLKRNNQGTNSSNINNKSFSHSQTRPQDADLTAIIKDLKESSDLLCSTTAANTSSSNNKMMGKRTTAGRSNLQSSVYNTNVNNYSNFHIHNSIFRNGVRLRLQVLLIIVKR